MSIKRIECGKRMSQAVICNGMVYLAGQVATSETKQNSVAEQTRSALAEVDRLLALAGTSKSNVVSASIWLADISTFNEMNSVWDQWVAPGCAPARATVEAKLAAPIYLVEISVVAALQ
ncbi:MAG: RidA family protein [Povalibacter sp.]|jgi:enamine deaminase RidA (YjgF/YER057c/UK114 family)